MNEAWKQDIQKGSGDRKELLEIIASKAGCNYLSDINLPIYREKVRNAIEAVDEEGYTMIEWQDTVGYIVDEEIKVVDNKQAKEILLQKLWKKHY